MLTEDEVNERLDQLPWYRWQRVDPNRPNVKQFIQFVKNRIDRLNDFEFNGDYTKMRRIETVEQSLDPEFQWMRKLKAFDWVAEQTLKSMQDGTFSFPIINKTKKK